MRITYRGDYALKAMLGLTIHYGEIVTIHDLASAADIPLKFLEQVLLDLKRAGFVESRRGKVGGYMLARHPSRIKIGEVIRFVDGPVEPIDCLSKNYNGCKDIYRCAFRKIWQEVGKVTAGIVDSVTFQDIARETKHKRTLVK
ncbi:MAG: Rrf2 family transcriptional regulator [Candidatus Omnitrophota bacterium]